MKITQFVAGVAFTLATGTFAASQSLSTDVDKLSYSIGVDLATSFKNQGVTVNPDLLLQGMKDTMNGKPRLFTDQQIKLALDKFKQELEAKRQGQDSKKLAEYNKRAESAKMEGQVFLQANKSKPDVVTLPSGLQYKIINVGTGKQPLKTDEVTVEYSGKFINGQEFDSTKPGKPATFGLDQVIPGWTEALQLMSEGSTWEVYIPPNLAYGSRSAGIIGPNETLIFTIHLISVNKKN